MAALIGGAVLLGWAFDVSLLKRLHPDWPSMKPNTAAGLVLAGLGLASRGRSPQPRVRTAIGRAACLLLAVLALTTLASYALGRDLGIDQILFHDVTAATDRHGPGRMAPVTAVNLFLLAIAIATVDVETKHGYRPSQCLALLGAYFCLVTVMGYLYATPASQRFAPFSSVALHTALALTLLWMGVLFARPKAGFVAEITSPSQGGGLARRLLPTAVVASVLLGYLRVLGQRAGLYGWEYGVALFGTANALVFGLLVWEGARWLNRLDAEHRQAVRDRALSDERYRRFFEQNLAGACITRTDGTILEVNPAFARIFGFASVDEARGTAVTDLYPGPAQPPDLLARLRRERYFVNLDLDMQRRDGRPLSLRADIVGGFDPSDDLVEVRGYVQDVTEQRRVELQLQRAQKMEAVGQLAGGIAHDFNNLLGVMGGYADLLRRDLGPTHASARRVEAIRKAVERAATLTRQLLAFSRHQPVETRNCDLNKIVGDVEKMLRRLLGEDVRLVAALDTEIGQVRADVGQLEQVLVNLAVNARDAMPEGGKLIIETAEVELDEAYVRTHPEARAGRHVMLAVSDTGHGMDQDTVSRIFEPFFTTKAAGKGTGLGLAVVYGIVKRFDGHVAVYSEPGRGSTFKVYLPALPEEASIMGQEEVARPALPRGTETVLLIEDEEALRAVISEQLRSGGYRVLEAGDPDSALAAAAQAEGAIHLLLTDVILPSRSGPRAAAELQARLPGLRVLYMSGYTDRAVEGHEHLPSASHFLQKPFSLDALLERVRAVLEDAPRA